MSLFIDLIKSVFPESFLSEKSRVITQWGNTDRILYDMTILQ